MIRKLAANLFCLCVTHGEMIILLVESERRTNIIIIIFNHSQRHRMFDDCTSVHLWKLVFAVGG